MKKLQTIILICGTAFCTLRPAIAAQLRISDGSTTVTVTDGDLLDSNPDPGVVTYNGPVGPNWTVNITSGSTKPTEGSAASPFISVGTTSFSSAAGTLTMDFTETGFTASGPASVEIGGTTPGDVTCKLWMDPANTLFGETTLVSTVGPLTPTSGSAFSGTGSGVVSSTTPYSLTVEAIVNHPSLGLTTFTAPVTITPPTCSCGVTFDALPSISICERDTIEPVTAHEDCGAGPVPVNVSIIGTTTSGVCPQIITITNSASDDCGNAHVFVQTVTVNCRPDCTITTSVTSTTVGTANLTASVPDAGPGATYNWVVINGTITSPLNSPTITWTAGTDTTIPISITATVTSAAGCSSTCSASVRLTPNSPACTIFGVTLSNTSWNKFNIPSGTSPQVWVHAHIGGLSGIPKTGVTTVQFVGVTLTLGGTSYTLPDGVLTFDSSAPSKITTSFTGGKWVTLINPNNLSDEMFFTGAAIPVTAAVAAGTKATLTYTTLASVEGISFSWQWSAAVFTYWPSDWNQAMIQPYHQSDHAGTPLNTTVQKSLIQGPRGGGGSNFTGSWSATGTAECQ